MPEFLLPSSQWPSMPSPHRAFLDAAIPRLQADPRITGLAAGGSFISGALDEHSDLDLIVVASAGATIDLPEEGQALAAQLGSLLAAFTGEHVGAPQLLICLYDAPLLHVDLKFVSSDELAVRVEDLVVLWDRSGAVRRGLSVGEAAYPEPDLQWIEDTFWTWVHFTAAKIGRGELFAALDALAFIRGSVLGPLILAEAGAQPSGVRRIERAAPDRAARLRSTLGAPDPHACRGALDATVVLYVELRRSLAPRELQLRDVAERAVRRFLSRTK